MQKLLWSFVLQFSWEGFKQGLDTPLPHILKGSLGLIRISRSGLFERVGYLGFVGVLGLVSGSFGFVGVSGGQICLGRHGVFGISGEGYRGFNGDTESG